MAVPARLSTPVRPCGRPRGSSVRVKGTSMIPGDSNSDDFQRQVPLLNRKFPSL